jgi:hypothetical protein
MFSTLEELRAVDMDWLQSLQVLAANWNILFHGIEIDNSREKGIKKGEL